MIHHKIPRQRLKKYMAGSQRGNAIQALYLKNAISEYKDHDLAIPNTVIVGG
ncbi:MAG: hypothetical protein WKI04_03395 [Ferruginibacter sp.]